MDKTIKNLTIKLLTTAEELESVREFWQKHNQHPYSDFEYFALSSQIEKRFIQPYVFVLYQNDEPVTLLAAALRSSEIKWRFGYLPLFKSKVKSIDVSYRGIYGDLSEENCNLLVKALLDTLKTGKADMCFFDHLRIDSPFYKAVKRIPKWRSRDNADYENPHWTLFLENSFEIFYKTRSKNTKSNIRKYRNRMIKNFGDDLRLEFYTKLKDIPSAVENIETVAQKTYQRSLGAGFLNNEETLVKWEFLAKKNRLFNAVLFIKEKPIAYWDWILYNGVAFSIATGYDPEYHYYHPGHYLLIACIEYFCNAPNCDMIDYGFGEAQYKRMLGSEMWLESPVSIFAPNLKGLKLKLMKMLTIGTSQSIISILEKLGLLGFIKKLWRKKLSSK
ncbi:hypothetical protein B6D60_12150 [candidate division KSB1 bacterium 4484_87]|nr:MAG: hypothetical protein B6D60_12150 [candidate division KSB1 bacterium 4484_87]